MKKIILIFCFLFFSSTLFAQNVDEMRRTHKGIQNHYISCNLHQEFCIARSAPRLLPRPLPPGGVRGGVKKRRGKASSDLHKKEIQTLGLDFFFVEIVGVEPTTPCLQGRCSSQLSYTPDMRT